MTRQEMEEILKKSYKGVNPEEPDGEQQYYNKNISEIRYAIKNELLKPEDVDKQTIYEWINNGISDSDLLERISRFKEEQKKREEQEKEKWDAWERANGGGDELDVGDRFDVGDGFDVDDGFDVEDYLAAMQENAEKVRKFMGGAAEQSILPQNANVKNRFVNGIKEFLKEKAEKVKNVIKDMFER